MSTPQPIQLPDWQRQALSEGIASRITLPMEPQPPSVFECLHLEGSDWWARDEKSRTINGPYSPPYPPGSLLYAQEVWDGTRLCGGGSLVSYHADGDEPVHDDGKWWPAEQMPPWASRLWLTVKDARPVRLVIPETFSDEIEDRAVAEGIDFTCAEFNPYEPHHDLYLTDCWKRLWNAAHPSHPWEPGRWAWTFEVERAGEST